MRLSVIFRYIGIVMLFMALFMLASAGVSYINHVDTAFYPLLISFMLTVVLGVFPLIFVTKDPNATMTNKESYCIVVGAWLLSCVVGMFPYLIWGGEFSLVNAWFESVSGFTATGASILENIECPEGDLNGPLQVLFSSLDYDDYVGRIGVGRVERGRIKRNQQISLHQVFS